MDTPCIARKTAIIDQASLEAEALFRYNAHPT